MSTRNKIGKYALVFCASFIIFLSFVPYVSLAITTEEQARCDQLQKALQIDPSTLNPDRQSEILQAGNLAQGLPDFCTANSLLLKVINTAIIIAGSIAVLFLIVGGFWYLTSAGNEEQAEKGRKTAVNSIIGLVIIIMSYAIIRIVAALLTSR